MILDKNDKIKGRNKRRRIERDKNNFILDLSFQVSFPLSNRFSNQILESSILIESMKSIHIGNTTSF